MTKNKPNMSMYQVAWRTIVLNFKLRWARSKWITILTVLLLIQPGIFSALSAPVMEMFISGVEYTAQGRGMGLLLIAALTLCAVRVLSAIMDNLKRYVNEKEYMRVRCDLSAIMMRAFSRKEPICYEHPQMLNDIEKTKRGIDSFTDFFVYGFGDILYTSVYLIGTAAYMGSRSPLLMGIMLVSMVPMLIAAIYSQKQRGKHEDKEAPVRRAAEYCEKAMIDRENFKETRLTGAFSYFQKKYREHIREQVSLSRSMLIHETCANTLADLLSLVGFAVMLVVMVYELINGNIEAAAFAAIFANLLSIFQEISYFFFNAVYRMMHHLPPLKNMFTAMDMPEREGEAAEADGLKGVQLINVHFRYPGAENEAVRGVTLEIKPKETIAIVGENGAGKTTLVRLLTGLYLPTEGSVSIGGKDTKKIDMPSAVKNSSAVFQKYMKYKLPLHENVRVSEIDKNEEIAAVLAQAGLPVDSACFPDGEATMLSREFDGVDLSGGQWQRVAIARGLYRTHGLIVLDEPTAAIDPLEETRVYQQFARISKDKTAVIVTHRMGSAKIADRIVVMKDGVIDDIGTHDELMARDGEYARMVDAQAEWYAEEFA